MGIKYLCLHVHSDQSIRDGAQTPTAIVKRVKELGAPAVTLTDHGVLTGTFEFLKACKSEGIKGIPGVEAYVCENTESNSFYDRKHLILLAKDLEGYHAIEKAVSESNTRIVELRTKSIPTMNKAMLMKWFGPGSIGYGHVFATSACVQGVLASELRHNTQYEKIIEKASSKQKEVVGPDNPKYKELAAEYDAKVAEMEDAKTQISEQKKRIRPTKKIENKLKKAAGTPDESAIQAELDDVLRTNDQAADKISELQGQLTVLKGEEKQLRERKKGFEKSFEKFNKYQQQIDEAKAELLDAKTLMDKTKAEAEWYLNCFGKENFFVEIQYHGSEDERFAFPRLVMIAKMLDIKLVPANDAHYTNKEDVRRREILVADSFKRPLETIEPENMELYIKTDEEIKDMLYSIIGMADVDQAFENLKIIADNCNVEFPTRKAYPVYKKLPEGETSQTYIRKLTLAGIETRFPGGIAPDGTVWDQAHIDRMEYELHMIDKMGFNDYHLVVQDYLNYGRKLGFDCPEKVGYTIGPGRGSAVGSLVCYLLGITDLDPLKYDLYFERYLNPERATMPDIDADFANCIRDKVIEYERSVYGNEGVCGITTKGTLKIKAAILTAGRVNPATAEDIGRVRQISKLIPADAKKFKDPIDPKDPSKGTVKEFLLSKYDPGSVERQIIEDAASIEGLTTSFGRHAAGVIMAETGDASDYVALMYTKDWAVQCVKEEVEGDVGLLKFDFLGLINLDIITETMRKIYRNYGIRIDMMSDIKFEEEVFNNIFATGNTDAVFQFASGGMKKMLQEFQPSCFEDLILLVAAYRPGPMQHIPAIIAVKHGQKAVYAIPELEPILAATYGKPIYQEQVQAIFKSLAGYSLGQADLVRRAMSKKKLEALEKEREAFLHGDPSRKIAGCAANGINLTEANKLFDELLDFASYGFNKSHAAAYAYVAYQTAWFKYHYPAEYMASVLECAKYEKIAGFIFNIRNMGLTVLTPDINESDFGFKAKESEIRFGFKGMKGVGDADIQNIMKERNRAAFVSIKDFLERTDISKASWENLVYGGAFDKFNTNRHGMFEYGIAYRELKKKREENQAKIERIKMAAAGDELSEKDQKKIDGYQANIEMITMETQSLSISSGYEDTIGRLLKEKDILSTFISDHPVNGYKRPKDATKISDLNVSDNGYSKLIFGLITDLKMLSTKSDHAPFCSFKLDDTTGTIDVTIFPKDYAAIAGSIREHAVIAIEGKIKTQEQKITTTNEDGEEIEETELIAKFIGHTLASTPHKKLLSLILNLKTAAEWPFVKDDVLQYQSDNSGYNLLIYDTTLGELRETNCTVTSALLNDARFSVMESSIIS